MKHKIKRRLSFLNLAKLAIAPALFALLGIASPTMAAPYTGPCAGAPDFIDGDGTITDGDCAGRTITATGALSVTSGGAVSAASLSGATLTVQGSSVTVPSLSSASGPVVVNATGGAATLGTINSNGQATIASTGGAVTTDNVTTTNGELNIKSNGAFAINTKILTANNGYIKVDSGKTLTIVGLTKTTLYDIELKAVNNLKTDMIEAGRNISLTSSSGNVNTKDLTADQGTLKVKADIKITIVGITKTNKLDIDLDAKNIVKTNAITSGSHIRVNSTDENINITSTVDSNIDDTSGGNILLTANKSIFTRAINTHGNTKVGSVRIVANKGGANTLFVIGTTATTNGVKGTITTNTVTGGGTSPTLFTFGISIQNGGTETSAGGITVTAAANLKVAASNSKAGTIILDAKNGTLTLPAGTLNANAASGKQAGIIVLLAKTVTTASGTILSATQGSGAAVPASAHSVSIAAETLNLAGPVGLKIQTNGNGVSGFPGLATLSPQGSVTATSDDNSVFFVFWQLSNFASTTTAKPLTVTGAAPLTMISDGNENQVLASGHPLKFSNSALTLQSRGKLKHRVDVVYNGADDGSTNIVFDNSLTNVTLDANGQGGAGGKVSVYGDKIDLSAVVFNITAIGPLAGNGNGGELYFRSTAATLNPASKVSFKADAATVGTGNAIIGATDNLSVPKAITFFPGSVSVDIGTGNGQYSFSANGGMAGGNAGTIQISSLPVRIMTVDAITASAPGAAGNGAGGEIFFSSRIESVDPVATMSAIGKGTGKGGKFTANHQILDLDILQFVKVDGGTAVPTTKLNGSIRLNGIWCRQWKLTGGQAWPKTHWVCSDQSDNPLVPVALSVDTAAADVAKSAAFNNATLRALLGNAAHKAHIFVFADNTQFNSFWWEGLPAATGGLTFRIPAASTNIYVNPWQSGTIGGSSSGSYNYSQAKEVAAHEFGHAVDIANGLLSKTTYGTYVLRDLYDLNIVQDTSQPGTVFISRLPCAPTPFLNGGASTGNPPFLNVTDIGTNQPVCIQNLMTGQWELNSFGFPGNPNNIQILQAIEGGLWNPAGQVPPTAPFVEAHAQAFGYQVTGNLGARPMNDKVIDNAKPLNKYMGCVQAWAAAELIGLTSPAVTPTTPSGSCGTAP